MFRNRRTKYIAVSTTHPAWAEKTTAGGLRWRLKKLYFSSAPLQHAGAIRCDGASADRNRCGVTSAPNWIRMPRSRPKCAPTIRDQGLGPDLDIEVLDALFDGSTASASRHLSCKKGVDLLLP
jgi:hypothetical protein